MIALIFLGKLATHLGKRFRGSNAHAHRNIRPELDFRRHLTHHLHQVEVSLIAIQVTEALVDAIVLHMLDRLAQDIGHSLAHGGIEIHIGGEHRHTIPFHDVPYLEDRIATMQPYRLGFGSERNDATVIA